MHSAPTRWQDQVIPGSSRSTEVRSAQEPQLVNEDVEVEEVDAAPKKQPKKKKEKKIAPMGRNGLKKKRVVKQKTFMDDGGYFGIHIRSYVRSRSDPPCYSY